MQRADRQSPAVSLGLQDSPHAERIGVAYIVSEVDHRLQVMPIDQSADAVTLVGAHRRKAQAMCFGRKKHANGRHLVSSWKRLHLTHSLETHKHQNQRLTQLRQLTPLHVSARRLIIDMPKACGVYEPVRLVHRVD